MKKEIEKAIAYGMGFVAGKHNLKLTKAEIKRTLKSYLENRCICGTEEHCLPYKEKGGWTCGKCNKPY